MYKANIGDTLYYAEHIDVSADWMQLRVIKVMLVKEYPHNSHPLVQFLSAWEDERRTISNQYLFNTHKEAEHYLVAIAKRRIELIEQEVSKLLSSK